MTMMQVNCGNFVFIFDGAALVNAYGAHALRVEPSGTIEVFIANPDGGEWLDIEEATLVEMTGKPTKLAKKN